MNESPKDSNEQKPVRLTMSVGIELSNLEIVEYPNGIVALVSKQQPPPEEEEGT